MIARRLRYPPLTPELRERLAAHYAEDVARLSELIGRDLSMWTADSAGPPRAADPRGSAMPPGSRRRSKHRSRAAPGRWPEGGSAAGSARPVQPLAATGTASPARISSPIRLTKIRQAAPSHSVLSTMWAMLADHPEHGQQHHERGIEAQGREDDDLEQLHLQPHAQQSGSQRRTEQGRGGRDQLQDHENSGVRVLGADGQTKNEIDVQRDAGEHARRQAAGDQVDLDDGTAQSLDLPSRPQPCDIREEHLLDGDADLEGGVAEAFGDVIQADRPGRATSR